MTIDEAISTLRTLCATAPTNDWATRVHIHGAMTEIEAELGRLGVEIKPAALPRVGPNGQIIHGEPAPAAAPGVATRSPASPSPARV